MKENITPNSSNVEHCEYDTEKHTLLITFKGFRQYIYSNVDEFTWDALCRAVSVGDFVNRKIVNKYPTERL